ncbi:MAG: hypothetical protein ACKOU6_08620, partial [Planctomycetota bacterium]
GLTGVVAWLRASTRESSVTNASFTDSSVAHEHTASANLSRPTSHSRLSRTAAYLAAITYVYGGPFLIQYSNVIYLVGAAWLPWACYAIERLQQSRAVKPIIHLAVILALMTLGGDPQMSYHVGLIALLRLLISPRVDGDQNDLLSRGARLAQLARLACAGTVAIGLGAIQIWPAWNAVSQSGRTSQLPAAAAESLDLARDTHEAARYEFSVGPWQWAEILWPNVGGRLFPRHQRWWSALPADGRVWCPSLFMGVLPAALMLTGLSFTTKSARIRWLTFLFVLALGAASGWYGGGWLAREIGRACGWPAAFSNLPPEFGSPYWLFVQLLPGYASFRYPGKWLVVANLALAVLAAHSWDRIRTALTTVRLSLSTSSAVARSNRATGNDASVFESKKLLRRWRQVLLLLSLLTAFLGISQLMAQWLGWWQSWLSQAPADPWLGPLDQHGAARDFTTAWLQTASLLALAWWSTRRMAESRPTATDGSVLRKRLSSLHALAQRHAATAWLVVVLLDLWSASHWLVQFLPVESNSTDSPTLASDSTAAASRVARAWRADWVEWLPPEWALENSAQRLRATQTWEEATEFPKWNLRTGRGIVSREESLMREDWLVYWNLASEQGLPRPDGSSEPRIELLRLLAINELLLPAGTRIPSAWHTRLEKIGASHSALETSNLERYRLIRPLPRAWLADRLVVLRPLEPNHETACLQQTRHVLHLLDSPLDEPQLATVETSNPSDVAALEHLVAAHQMPAEQPTSADLPPITHQTTAAARGNLPSLGTVRLVVDRANQVELEVESRSPALCVLADRYDDDWQVEVHVAGGSPSAHSSSVLRTNRLIRGVVVPAGKSTVSFAYRPWRVWWGAAVSAICGIACGIFLLIPGSSNGSSGS